MSGLGCLDKTLGGSHLTIGLPTSTPWTVLFCFAVADCWSQRFGPAYKLRGNGQEGRVIGVFEFRHLGMIVAKSCGLISYQGSSLPWHNLLYCLYQRIALAQKAVNVAYEVVTPDGSLLIEANNLNVRLVPLLSVSDHRMKVRLNAIEYFGVPPKNLKDLRIRLLKEANG